MFRGGRLLIAALVCILANGCRDTSPVPSTGNPQIDAALREYRKQVKSRIASARLEMMLFHSMSDARMVASHRQDGLGFAIRVDQPELHVGEPLKLHLAYENIAAPPVSATTCQGFNISEEDTVTATTTAVAITPGCDRDDPLRDNHVELRRGILKTADIVVEKTQLSFDHPGQYILNASWQSFYPRDGLFQRGDEYSSMPSNMVLITVR